MILVSILMISVFLSILAFALITYSTINLSRARTRVLTLQAQYAGESGADAAISILNSGNTTYTGTGGDVALVNNAPHYRATYSVTVTAGANDKEKYITATGKVYSPSTATTPKYTRQIEVYSQRSSNTTSSAIVGRNTVWVDPGVQNLTAKDLNLGGFMWFWGVNNRLIAESITATGQTTWLGQWCGLFGPGPNLQKPATFSNPAQTKTNIRLRANNCVNPPGNTTNADFDVLVNQTNLTAIQSTYIPWNLYMDASYGNAPGGCNDWTTGVFPRTIPSAGNVKKTHYPNALAGVDASGTCAAGGDLNLATGQYNITDNVHLRAHLCLAAGCTPTFYNPDNGQGTNPRIIKFIFVEGRINFNSLNTAANSGPIVFVSYGVDPGVSLITCPLSGRSVTIGSTASTNAPAAYIVASNGICLNRTRLATPKALGGLSAKSIYIGLNAASPNLEIDPAFPVNEIPVDLTWKSTRYRRL